MNKRVDGSEWCEFLKSLTLLLALFGACFYSPALAEMVLGNWGALVVSFGALLCWIKLVPPMPGLAMGFISLAGIANLLFNVIFWIQQISSN